NRITAIKQDALVAVDIDDLELEAAGRGEARIVGKNAGLGGKIADVQSLRPQRAVVNCKRIALVAARHSAGLQVGAGLRVHGLTLDVRLSETARSPAIPGYSKGRFRLA